MQTTSATTRIGGKALEDESMLAAEMFCDEDIRCTRDKQGERLSPGHFGTSRWILGGRSDWRSHLGRSGTGNWWNKPARKTKEKGTACTDPLFFVVDHFRSNPPPLCNFTRPRWINLTPLKQKSLSRSLKYLLVSCENVMSTYFDVDVFIFFSLSFSFSYRSSARLIIRILSRMVLEEGGRNEGGFYKKARPIRLLQRQRRDWLSLRYTAVLQQWRRARGITTRRAASSRGYVLASRVRLWADASDAVGRVREQGDDVATLWNSALRPRFWRARTEIQLALSSRERFVASQKRSADS